MIEGKLIDGLRSVAARMTMDELHENRSEFVQEVQNAISEDLLKNGLELEAVSLTALDQTPFDALDENNAFNAVGMRKLAEVIAKSRKERAAITAEADVSVRRSEMEAEKLKYSIERDQREAEIAKNREIEILQADQLADIARNQEEADRSAQEAKIEKERSVRAAEIERERQIQDAEISKEREIEVADQERKIIVAKKSEEESHARAEADKARAAAMTAEEAIETARSVASAERAKQIALIEATKEAERAATGVKVRAEAEKDAASDRAAALLEEAQAEATSITIRAEAKKADMLAEAEGARAIADSENALSAEIVAMKVALARLEAMPRIVAEMVKPAEKIDSIKIHQVTGMNAGNGGSGAGGGAPVNQALDSIMGMALQMPAMKKLGEELGLSMEGGLASVANEAFDVAPVEEAELDTTPKDSA